jgi:hypothetical protein
MSKLYDIELASLAIASVVDELTANEVRLCDSTSKLSSPDSTFQPNIENCLVGLSKIFSDSPKISAAIWLSPSRIANNDEGVTGNTGRSYSISYSDSIDDFVRDYHVPVWRTFLGKMSSANIRRFAGLEDRVDDLIQTMSEDNELDDLTDEQTSFYATNFGNLISVNDLVRFSKLLRSSHKFFLEKSMIELADGNQTQKLPRPQCCDETGLKALQIDQRLLSLAIVQQNALSGDQLLEVLRLVLFANWQELFGEFDPNKPPRSVAELPKLKFDFFEPSYRIYVMGSSKLDPSGKRYKIAKETLYQDALLMLSKNPVLRRNFGRYLARRGHQGEALDVYSRSYAALHNASCRDRMPRIIESALGGETEVLHKADQRLLQNPNDANCLFLKFPSDIVRKDTALSGIADQLESKAAFVELPEPAEVIKNSLELTSHLKLLLDEKERVKSEIVKLQILLEFSKNKQLVPVEAALAFK